MAEIELDFKPNVPVFDANMVLGRRHNRRCLFDTAPELIGEMDRLNVDRALVYTPHAVSYDSREGNDYLLQLIDGESRLVPQFVCNPSADDLQNFAQCLRSHRIRSIRMLPAVHGYPFRDWVVGPWLEWAATNGIPVWLPVNFGIPTRRSELDANQLDPEAVHDTLSAFPKLQAVLCETQIRHITWVLPLLRSLPNLAVELSRHAITDGVQMFISAVGVERILFGSRFPDSPLGAHLFHLFNCGLAPEPLRLICSGNLERLLALET